MSIKIIKDFDYRKEKLDGNEIITRDLLNVDIENWCKFRRVINVGLDPNNLKSKNIIANEIKDAYMELAKTHYLIVTHLGILKISLGECGRNLKETPLHFKKSIKEFYFFAGTIFDNLARLIYIINDQNGVSEKNRYGNYVRHWIDWGELKNKNYYGYKKIVKNKIVKEIFNLRNIFTHSWDIIMVNYNGNLCFPEKHRKERFNPIWYYNYEENKFKNKYKDKYLSISKMMNKDYEFIEKFQNKLFKRLYSDVNKFEKNNNVKIV